MLLVGFESGMLLVGFERSSMGRPRKHEIELSEAERDSLSDLVRSRTAPHGLVRRARIVLASAEGTSNTEMGYGRIWGMGEAAYPR